MSTMKLEYQNRQSPVFKIIFIIIGILICFWAVQYGNHATARHGERAEKARNCLENNNILFVMTNFLNGKCAVVGEINSPNEKGIGEYGVNIVKDGKEITSFTKIDLLKTVIRYLENVGYFLPPE